MKIRQGKSPKLSPMAKLNRDIKAIIEQPILRNPAARNGKADKYSNSTNKVEIRNI